MSFAITNTTWQKEQAAGTSSSDLRHIVVAHTGLEPVISALRGQRVNQLHQCAAACGIIGGDGCGGKLANDLAAQHNDFCYTARALMQLIRPAINRL